MSGFWQKYRNKYRITILNDTTLEEFFWVRLSRINIITIIGIITIFFLAIIFLLLTYTSLKEFIPGYPDGETRTNIVRNVYKLDSIEYQTKLNQQYMDNIKAILQGDSPTNHLTENRKSTTNKTKDTVSLNILKNDSVFRARIENESGYDMLSATVNLDEAMVFFAPIKGIVTNEFNPKNKHFGVDIVGKSDQEIFACYQGTVILSTWSWETGYVVIIQHKNDLISVYKHLKDVRVKQGDKLLTGKQIGRIGDVGTLSTGPHLHFELWRDGQAICPNDFIKFN